MSETNGNNAAAATLDSILDGTLDDIADLPSFAAWPAGAYKVVLKEGFAEKKINDHPAFELKLMNQETLELNNAAETEETPKVGDECSLSFMMDNDTGKGFFKEAIKPIVAHLQASGNPAATIRDAVSAAKGLECIAILGRRTVKDKDSGEVKLYPSLKKLEVL